MQMDDKRILEKEILDLAEQIIESTIKIGAEEFCQDNQAQEGAELVCALANKLSFFLDGKDEYVPEFLRQVVQQKIPDERVLSSFPNFAANLHFIINKGIDIYQALSDYLKNNQEDSRQETERLETKTSIEDIMDEEVVTEEIIPHMIDSELEVATESENHIVDEVEEGLLKFFPNLILIKNYKLHGIKLEYFFPEINLAFEKESDSNSAVKPNVWKEYHCSKAGIRLIKLEKQELMNNRNLSKRLKKLWLLLQKNPEILNSIK